MEIEVRGERLVLLPERALAWPAQRMLMIADMHCGKAATFRARHIPIPEGSMEADFQRLSRLIDRTRTLTLSILGDWIHASAGCTPHVMDFIRSWRQSYPDLRVQWIRGNHDKAPEEFRAQFGFEESEGAEEGPFWLSHAPEEYGGRFTIGGHIHPKIAVGGRGFPRVHVPCFVFASKFAVLPAFGSFTGGQPVTKTSGNRVFLATGDAVIEWNPV